MSASWVDVSVELKTGMVHWPGDGGFRITQVKHLNRGDCCTLSVLRFGSHTGTHVDAPAHFIRRGRTLDAMPLDATVGVARVIAIRDPTSITRRELARSGLRRGDRVLLKTRNSQTFWKSDRFVDDFVYVSTDAAAFLVERGVRMVGIDYLSVGGLGRKGRQTHEALLGAGIWIVEGLNLARVPAGTVDLICLPLRILNGDGAPARVIVRVRHVRVPQCGQYSRRKAHD